MVSDSHPGTYSMEDDALFRLELKEAALRKLDEVLNPKLQAFISEMEEKIDKKFTEMIEMIKSFANHKNGGQSVLNGDDDVESKRFVLVKSDIGSEHEVISPVQQEHVEQAFAEIVGIETDRNQMEIEEDVHRQSIEPEQEENGARRQMEDRNDLVKYENLDGDSLEYVEECPAEIILQGNEIIVKKWEVVVCRADFEGCRFPYVMKVVLRVIKSDAVLVIYGSTKGVVHFQLAVGAGVRDSYMISMVLKPPPLPPEDLLLVKGGANILLLWWDFAEGTKFYSLEAELFLHSLCFSVNRYWLCLGFTLYGIFGLLNGALKVFEEMPGKKVEVQSFALKLFLKMFEVPHEVCCGNFSWLSYPGLALSSIQNIELYVSSSGSCSRKIKKISGTESKEQDCDSIDELDDGIPTECEQRHFHKVFESVFMRNGLWLITQHVPSLGDTNAYLKEVYAIYSFWYNFKSWREFPHEDEYDLAQTEPHDHKRWIERHNAKLSETSWREEYVRIRSLVDNGYKKDPRILRRNEQEKGEKQRKKQAKYLIVHCFVFRYYSGGLNMSKGNDWTSIIYMAHSVSEDKQRNNFPSWSWMMVNGVYL